MSSWKMYSRGEKSEGVRALQSPHPALRATFSRWEKELPKRFAFVPLILLALIVTNAQTPAPPAAGPQAVISQYCATCHSDKAKTRGLPLELLDVMRVGANAQTCEKD